MSLDKRSIPVDLTGGLQKGKDDFATEGNARVRDSRFRLDGQIGKRSGSSDQRQSGLPALGSTDRNAIVELDAVPHILTGDGSYRFDIAASKWRAMNRGAPRPSRITTSPLVRTNDSLKRPDCAVIGSLLCTVWEDPETSQGFYAFHDVSEDTPRLISGPTAFATTIDHLRVIAVGAVADVPDRFVVVGRDAAGVTAGLYQCQYAISAADYTFGASVLITLNCTASVCVEPASNAKQYYVAVSAGGTARWRLYSAAAALLASTAMTTAANLPTAMLHNPVSARLVSISPNGNLTHIADDLSGVDATVLVLAAPASGAPFTFGRAAICLADEIGGMWVARSFVGSSAYSIGAPICTQITHLDVVYKIDGVDQVPGQYVLAGSALYTTPTGPIFAVANQFSPNTTTPAAGTTAFQNAPVGFYVRPVLTGTHIDLVTMGRFGQDQFYGYDYLEHLPHHCTDHVTKNLTTGQRRSFMPMSVGANDGASCEGRKIDLVSAAFWYADAARNVTAQGLRLLGNGCGTTALDGSMIADNTPDVAGYLTSDGVDTTITQISNIYWTTPGVTTATFIIVWRWRDAKGNIHRSAPSSPYGVTSPSSGGGNNPLKIVFATQRPTGLLGDQYALPEVEVYMTLDVVVGATYRLVGIVPPADDPAEEARSYFVIMNTSTSTPAADAIRYRIDASEGNWARTTATGLYTDTDELPSWPSPPLLDLVSTQSRLWGLSAEGARLDVWYTKPIAEGRAPEWSDTLRVLVPQEGGDVVGLAGLDDKVVCLKRRRIFVITGNPGDATGAGSSMQPPRALASDVGCIDVNSIVEGPFGVAFLSERGFYTLSRDLQLTFIGEPMIDAFSGDWSASTYPQPVVIASDIVPSESEVRWSVEHTRGAGSQIVAAWNYRLNKWSVQTAYDARSLCVADGIEWRLGYGSTATRAVRKETPDLWATGESDTQEIYSAWLKLNGIAGFQRLWRIVLTFRWYSGGIFVQTPTDNKAITETTKTWSEATLDTLVDATTRRVQIVVQPTVQRCESLRIHLVGGDVQGEAGRGFELIGCQLDIGIKKGSNKKLPSAARG